MTRQGWGLLLFCTLEAGFSLSISILMPLPNVIGNISTNLLLGIMGIAYLVCGPMFALMLGRQGKDSPTAQRKKTKNNSKHDKALSNVFTPVEQIAGKQ